MSPPVTVIWSTASPIVSIAGATADSKARPSSFSTIDWFRRSNKGLPI